jgi:hypothetical protein
MALLSTQHTLHHMCSFHTGCTQVPPTLQLHSDCPCWTFTATFYSCSHSRSLLLVLEHPWSLTVFGTTNQGQQPQCFLKERCAVQPSPSLTWQYIMAWIWSCLFKLWTYEEISLPRMSCWQTLWTTELKDKKKMLWLNHVMKFLLYMVSMQLLSLVMELPSPGFQLSLIPNI